MSKNLVIKKIDELLQSKSTDVYAITGEWGCGKTHTWNERLNNLVHSRGLAWENYSYVSLFGINSLDALKLSIFENQLETKLLKKEKVNAENAFAKLKSFGKKQSKLIIPLLDKYKSFAGFFAFSSVKNTLICIDDLERASDNLNVNDILGLVTQLKEQKNCKVVLLLNEENLSDTKYAELKEKSIDINLRFSVEVEEALDVAIKNRHLSSDEALYIDLIKGNSKKLGIKNIRILKKIKSHADEYYKVHKLVLEGHVKGQSETQDKINEAFDGILSKAIHNIVLFTYCHLSKRNDSIPDENFIRGYGSTYSWIGFSPEKDIDNETQNKIDFLKDYEFETYDLFADQIFKGIKNGYFNEGALETTINEWFGDINRAYALNEFNQSWDVFYSDLGKDQAEAINTVLDAYKRNIKYATISNASAIIRALRLLNMNDEIDGVIQFFVSNCKKAIADFDVDEIMPGEKIDNELLSAILKAQADMKIHEVDNAEDILYEATASWGKKEEAVLYSYTENGFVEFFKNAQKEKLHTLIKNCLRIARHMDQKLENSVEAKILTKLNAALESIAKESAINELRLSDHIKLNKEESKLNHDAS